MVAYNYTGDACMTSHRKTDGRKNGTYNLGLTTYQIRENDQAENVC